MYIIAFSCFLLSFLCAAVLMWRTRKATQDVLKDRQRNLTFCATVKRLAMPYSSVWVPPVSSSAWTVMVTGLLKLTAIGPM